MTFVRRSAAVVCILTILVAGVTSTASELLMLLVPLDPLFGTVVVASLAPEAADVSVRLDPVLPTLSPRAPPLG